MATQDLFANLLAYKEIENESSVPDYSSVFSSDANLGGQFENLLNQSGGWTISSPAEVSGADFSSVFKEPAALNPGSSQFNTVSQFNLPETDFGEIAQGGSKPRNLVKATNPDAAGISLRQQQRQEVTRQSPGAANKQQTLAPSWIRQASNAIQATIPAPINAAINVARGVDRAANKNRPTVYDQIDTRLFNGALPEGSMSPIEKTHSSTRMLSPNLKLSKAEQENASLLDLAATRIADSQPALERFVSKSPEWAKDVLSHSANKLPFSVNLFSRYLTGLGDRNLEVPSDIKSQIGKSINDESRLNSIREFQNQKTILNRLMQFPSDPRFAQMADREANDKMAEINSAIRRLNSGDIRYYGAEDKSTFNQNPLHNPFSSIGSAWFTPNKEGGYTAKDKYDFVYAGADKKAIGPSRIPMHSPSQEMISQTVSPIGADFKGKLTKLSPTWTGSPIMFGRAVVSKMPSKPFTWQMSIP